jgi:hypothetical protein
MNAPAFIADLQSRGAVLEVDGARLRVTPATVLTDADRNAWREHKAAILESLKAASRKEKVRSNSGVLFVESDGVECELPPALIEVPGLEFCDAGALCGLWIRRINGASWIVPTRGTRPSYDRFIASRNRVLTA